MSVHRSSPPKAIPAELSTTPEPVRRLVALARRPLDRFLHLEASSGILLLVAAAVAMGWANSPWADSYSALLHTPLGLRIGPFTFERPLEWFINDGLMAVFFFVVGLEIRREIHRGELSEWKRAALPAAAALGGMVAPALIYALVAGAPPTRPGWGIPMATDIAFAVGILTLLGRRVPAALRVLLLALAVIDDLGAIIVIALFYSPALSVTGLAIGAAGIFAIFIMQRVGLRAKLAYVPPALVTWAGVYISGVHPTIAGVIIGLITPVRAWLGPEGFIEGAQKQLNYVIQAGANALSTHQLTGSLKQLDVARREAVSPAEALIEELHPWVAFGIMPIFALANAGVRLQNTDLDATSWRVVAAVTAGLVLGKPLGILLTSELCLRLGIGKLPTGLKRRHLVVLGIVAGVGFTMALFIAQLAFRDPVLLAAAKIGILIASGAAAVLALVIGRVFLAPAHAAGAAESADDAEASTDL